MTDYITSDELRDYIGSDTTNFQSVVDAACTVASRAVEGITGRVFLDSGSVSARYFTPEDYYCCDVDDFSTASGLIIETITDYFTPAYGLTWTAGDYTLEPINQTQGPYAWPYTEIVATGQSKWFPPPAYGRKNTVKVTAQWGWAAVPDQVKQATLIAAARLFKLKDAPDGFIGMDGWGPVKIRENPEVRALLDPFCYSPVTVL